jgi:hypothetical protein
MHRRQPRPSHVFLEPNHDFPATSTKNPPRHQQNSNNASTLILLSINPSKLHPPDGHRVFEMASCPPLEAAVGCYRPWLVSRLHIIRWTSRSFQDRTSAVLNLSPLSKSIAIVSRQICRQTGLGWWPDGKSGLLIKGPSWLSQYQELFAVCQAFSGPASTKMYYCLNLIHDGFVPAVIALLIWR